MLFIVIRDDQAAHDGTRPIPEASTVLDWWEDESGWFAAYAWGVHLRGLPALLALAAKYRAWEIVIEAPGQSATVYGKYPLLVLRTGHVANGDAEGFHYTVSTGTVHTSGLHWTTRVDTS